MKLLFLDFESQSVDPATTNPTEVGALLLDVEPGESYETSRTLARLSQLLYEPNFPPQTEEIVELTGITDAMLQKDGLPPAMVFENHLAPLLRQADFAVAHNAPFDRGVYEATARRLGHEIIVPRDGWICTVQDVPWPRKYKCKKLSHLAYDHGILVPPESLHRAINDVELLARLLLNKTNLEEVIAYRNTPWAYLRAVVEPPWTDNGVSTSQAKKLGYSWEKVFGTELIFPKKWCRRVKENEIEAEKARCPFKLMRLTPTT